jgi:D-3-phosphoglycerate dehydrogenase
MVTYVPDFCTEEMSEHVILCILAFARQLPALTRAACDHRWLALSELPTPRRAAGQTLGILGFGRSGQRTASLARALGLEVLASTRTPRPADFDRTGARPASLAEVLGCDYVALQLPLTAATRGLIDRNALRQMKPTAFLINVARGAIVDTQALVEALREGRLAGAALDVVDPAPLPPTHPLWDMPNVLITSHSAGFSEEAYRQSLFTVAADTVAMAGGLPPLHPVPELRGTVTETPLQR